jgi:hypothetical protein
MIGIGSASGQSVLPPAADAFVAGANALAKSASERVDLGRANARLNSLQTDFTEKLLATKSAKPTFTLGADESKLLCDTRGISIEVAARRNYIQAVAGRIEEVGKPTKIDNLQSAIGSLFAGQSLDIKAEIPNPAELAKERATIVQRCEKDLANYDTAYYGKTIVAKPVVAADATPAAIPVFSAISALVDIVISVITPVVVEGAKIVDEVERRKAVIKFLKMPDNRKAILNSGLALATEVSLFSHQKRLKLSGAVVEKAAVVRNAQIDLNKNDNCKAFLKSGSPTVADKLSDDFILCWRGAWSQTEAGIAAFLKAAEDYDRLADAGNTDNARDSFKPLAESLEAIENDDEVSLKQFWNWATRLIAFAQKVETAFSKENKQKIDKAIDDLVKAL